MRRVVILLCGLILAGPVLAEKKYEEVDYKAFRLAPEDYKNRHITYVETFRGVSGTLASYMERSGMRPDKYLLVLIGEQSVPVLAKKTDEMTALASGFKAGDKVRVSGKVKRFSAEPAQKLFSRYYVRVDKLELVAQGLAPARKRPSRPRRPRKKRL